MTAANPNPVVRAVGVRKYFAPAGGLLDSLLGTKVEQVKAVDGVDLEISKGEILGLVGESGSGKTTMGEILVLLQRPTQGRIFLREVDLCELKPREIRKARRHMQIVFQDPFQSLDPRMTVFQTLLEPLRAHYDLSKLESHNRIVDVLERVGLRPPGTFLHKYPRELSGGERQRVAIARAVELDPHFIVADEPVSMLDVSVSSGILNLVLKLRDELGTAFLFITHDLAVARYISDRVAIMYRGKIVETGPVTDVIDGPLHPYTQLLLSAVPVADPTVDRPRVESDMETTDEKHGAAGCVFQARCTWVTDVCRGEEPRLEDIGSGHLVACFHHETIVARLSNDA